MFVYELEGEAVSDEIPVARIPELEAAGTITAETRARARDDAHCFRPGACSYSRASMHDVYVLTSNTQSQHPIPRGRYGLTAWKTGRRGTRRNTFCCLVRGPSLLCVVPKR